MLILPRSCFLHVPKTGGSWVKAAIAAIGIPFEEFTADGDVHADLSYCPCPDRFKFAFVRHPLEFYRSYWQFKMGVGWDARNPFDVDCGAPDFHTFIRNCLREHPGMCGQLFQDYVGPAGGEIEFIGRYERLADDLIAALKRAGERVDEDAIRGCPPQNVSDRRRFPAEYTRDLERAIRESEHHALEGSGMTDHVPATEAATGVWIQLEGRNGRRDAGARAARCAGRADKWAGTPGGGRPR